MRPKNDSHGSSFQQHGFHAFQLIPLFRRRDLPAG
jgi:hypothetical protein